MAMSTLLTRHVFGLKGDVADNVHFVDESTVVYPSGHNTVLYHVEQKMQKFIPGTADTEGITALALSSSRKFVAVAERAEKGMITVYDLHTLKRRKVLSTNDVGSKEYVSLSFSPDGKLLAAQGGAPEWRLVLWQWEKSKVAYPIVTTTNNASAPLYQVLFNPQDPSTVSVAGNGVFRVYKAADTNLKPLPAPLQKREPQNYTCHCWLPDDRERVVVATDNGDLLLIDAGEVKATLPGPGDGNSIECVVAYSKGFVCGGDNGVLSIYERSEDKDYYKRSKSFSIEDHHVKIKNLAVSPSDETLVCTLENNQVFVLGLSSTDILKPDEMNFELLSQSFHSQAVTGVDTCVRKPLVATCSSDKSVRIWNYLDKSSELVKFFPEEAHSVAFHPSGLHVLVGFSDKLRLMNLLMDDIRPYKEFGIKSCRECRFSHGGQYFAAVNGNTIQIFNTYTCENIGNLRGHNGKVRSVYWVPDDTKLVSAGMDGAVYEWKLRDFKRENENVLKGCNYTCVVATPDTRSIFAVGSDRKIKELDDTQICSEWDTGVVLTQVALPASGRTLFAASETGTVRAYKLPLNGEYHEYQCHSGAITRMRISFDDSLLFCVAEDGCLFCFDVRDKDGRGVGKQKEALTFAEEVLVTKSDLEDKKARMAELDTQVNDLTMQTEYKLRLMELNHQEKIKDLTEKYTHEIEGDKSKFELLLQEKNEQEMEYEEKLKQAEERHQQQMAALETTYQQKIMAEVERYQQLLNEKEMLNERWDEQNSLLVESHESVIQKVTEEYEANLQEEQMAMERLQQEKDESEREFEETKRQLEEDADREIEELKERYEQKLAAERESGLRLKGENGIMKKKFIALGKDIEEQKEEIKQLFEQKRELYKTISGLEKEIKGLDKEVKERDETISDKEKRIYDLKKKNQELEKFKFVLDYKIKELKKLIEPRELEIADMKEQIKEMDHELERYHKNNANLDLTISDLKLKLEGLQNEVLSQRQKNADSRALIKRFHHDLHETTQHIQEPEALKESVRNLYQKHVTEKVQPAVVEEDVQKEYNRQREYLEKSVESLKRKLHKDVELHRTDNMRIMQENVTLIKEINELRRELKALKQAQRVNADSKGGRAAGATPVDSGAGSAKELEMQRAEIKRLRDRVEELEGLVERVNVQRPMSRERLPPLDGDERFAGAAAAQ
eukprot:CAMPEP_0183813298 /NCGR_PEP_ID=MMETSP0803_2-20130417/52843_1 /TAXON_ID=195967 /ORGANISM="Crustomastix stigmata, Strain CCMP3273" /LENGTH=1181 /DNA_ID=CAMNT_0026058151 /DNA_START=28 /DNA_END=3573 /DNA_ORIENTATION=-